MPTQVILSMNSIYPFGTEYMPEKENQQVLVRKIILTERKNDYLTLAKKLKKWKLLQSIQIISIFQHAQSLEIYYEYIPIRFQQWMKNISRLLLPNIIKQLYQLLDSLAQNQVVTKFNPEQLGLDSNYHIKYFIDLDNTYFNGDLNPQMLRLKYSGEISEFIQDLNLNSFYRLSFQLNSSMDLTQDNKNQQINRQVKKFSTNMQRRSSVKTLQFKNRTSTNRTQTSEKEMTEFPTKIHQSRKGRQSYNIVLNQKILNIKQKLQSIKEKGSKVNQFESQVGRNGIKDRIKSLQYPKISRLNDGLEFKLQFSFGTSPTVNKAMLEKKLTINSDNSKDQILHPQNNNSNAAKNYERKCSQPLKTTQKTSSLIKCLDIARQSQSYIQDFIDVLDDSISSADCSFEEKIKQANEYKQQQKKLLMTQECKGTKQYLRLRRRLFDVISNGKNLIDKIRPSSKKVEKN